MVRFLKPILVFPIFILLLLSCSTEVSETPIPETTLTSARPTSTPTPGKAIPESCEEAEGYCLELTLDGESCNYEGPSEITAGPVNLFFYNQSENSAAVNFLKFFDGKTIEDVIEYKGEEPSTEHHPSWSVKLGAWEPIMGGISHWDGEIDPG